MCILRDGRSAIAAAELDWRADCELRGWMRASEIEEVSPMLVDGTLPGTGQCQGLFLF